MSNTPAVMQKTPLRQVASVKELLWNENARAQLASVAAKHMSPERMMRVVANAIRTTPLLQECEPMSFLGALMHCAALGLEPNTPLGHAYLIPFKNTRKNITEVQVVIGYKGFIDLARRSGQLASIHGDVVYDDDELWSHEYGSQQHLRHIPGPRKGNRIGAYCYAKLNLGDGITAEGHIFMTMSEIIAHRNSHSQGWKTAMKFGKTVGSPWDEKNPAFAAMAIKTAVRALANRGELPMSIEFMTALESDERASNLGAFAMDPAAGITIEGDASEQTAADEGGGETITADGEVIDQSITKKFGDAPATKAAPTEETKAPAATAKPVAQRKPTQQETRAAVMAHPILGSVLNDMTDFPVDDVLDQRTAVLDELRMREDPLMAEFDVMVQEFREADAERR